MIYLYIVNMEYYILVIGTEKRSTYILLPSNGKDVLEAPLASSTKFRA